MRKTLLLAATVAGVFGIVAVAWAANVYTVTTARDTPTKSGTLTNPKPTRVQFTPTPSSTSLEPETSAPAAIRNAADEGSAGTSIASSSSSSAFLIMMRCPPFLIVCRDTGALARSSSRSV